MLNLLIKEEVMSKNTGSSDQSCENKPDLTGNPGHREGSGSGETKPAPTGNPGTRGGSGGGEIKPAPTGNRGTFSEDPPIEL